MDLTAFKSLGCVNSSRPLPVDESPNGAEEYSGVCQDDTVFPSEEVRNDLEWDRAVSLEAGQRDRAFRL